MTATMFRLRVLGGFSLEGPDGIPVTSLPQRRAMAVLAVLATYGDLGCSRDRLLALLWPESDEAHARHGLRDALHAIRRALTPAAINSHAGQLRLDSSVVSADVQEFTRSLASGRLEDAVRAYRGPFLEGFHVDSAHEFGDWLTGERGRLERECVEALEHLATAAEAAGAWAEAARWWGRAVERDPLNSRFVLSQMEALSEAGDRANALRLWEQHVRYLDQELGLEPDAAALAQVERIRRGGWPAVREAAPQVPNGATTGSLSPVPDLQADQGQVSDRAGSPTSFGPPPAAARPRWTRRATGLAAAAVVVAGVAIARTPRPVEREDRAPRTAIAVLPFQNLATDSSQAWFAAGLHDELLTRLAKVAGLRVIGSASVAGYDPAGESLARIGEELAVGSVVEGAVQVQGRRLRVTVHLLDPVTGTELWAESYDRSLDDAFAVQSDIAQNIVTAVGVTLSGHDASGFTVPPPGNPEAWLLYLQGLEYASRPGDLPENLEIAQNLYERALRLDSTFALAHAALSTLHARVLYRRHDASPARAERQLEEARAALRFAPDLPEGRVAMALAYCCGRSSDRRALEEYQAAARSAPNDPLLWSMISVTHARLGNWDSVDVAFERARRLDPRNADLFLAQGNRLHCRRRYPEAIESYRRALLLAPDFLQPHVALAWSYVLWQGQLDTLRAVLRAPPDKDPGGGAPRVWIEQAILLLYERRPDSLLALIRAQPSEAWTSAEFYYTREDLAGSAWLLLHDEARARAAFDSAATLIDSVIRLRPDDVRLHATRGGVMAALGRKAEALAEVRWLEQTDEYRYDRSCPGAPEARAAILAGIGETDSALAAIERLLAGTSRVTAHTLRLDPLWDPLRGDARFQALLARYRTP